MSEMLAKHLTREMFSSISDNDICEIWFDFFFQEGGKKWDYQNMQNSPQPKSYAKTIFFENYFCFFNPMNLLIASWDYIDIATDLLLSRDQYACQPVKLSHKRNVVDIVDLPMKPSNARA